MAEEQGLVYKTIHGILTNWLSDLLRAIFGTSVLALVLAIWRYLRGRPSDWWGLAGLSVLVIVLFVILLRFSRSTTSKNHDAIDIKAILEKQRKEIEAQIPSLMVNGVPVAGPAAIAAEKAREEAASKPLGTLFSPLQIQAFQLSNDILKFIASLGPLPAPIYTKEEINSMSTMRMKELINAEDGDYAEACEYHFGEGTYLRRITHETPTGLAAQITAKWKRIYPWYRKIQAGYEADFKSKVEELCNRFVVQGIAHDVLLPPVEGRDGEKNLRTIAARLWELAYKVEEKEK